MTLWRIQLKTAGIRPAEFCIERDILGVGWNVDSDQSLDWHTYSKLVKAKYEGKSLKSWMSNVKKIREGMKDGDLCWARDRNGKYYIGRIEGKKWEYRGYKEEYRKADIVNVRPCRWFLAGEADSVPGKVLNAFRPRRTVQRVSDETASFYSRFLYNERCGRQMYDLPGRNARDSDFFALVGPEDCEDIVGIYLQEKLGYRMIPSSCKHATEKTEFILKNREGKRANVQVKQGCVDLDRDYYNDPSCDWFLFTTHGQYTGGEHSRVRCLKPDAMREFAFNNHTLMPDRIQAFIRFIKSASRK